MNGLMQDQPLNIPMILRHAEQVHARKRVTTRTDNGVSVHTLAETAERARKLMAALQSLGVKEDDRVATFCWNHQQHLETYVAAPCIGAILHTLNIRLFEQDLAYIVEHAQDSVVVVDKSLWPAWEKVAARVDCVKTVIVVNDSPGPAPEGTLDYETLIASHQPLRDLPDIGENHACAMCYTSGTTGHPKGVLYSHRSNVLHSFMAMTVDSIGLSEADTVLPIVPMFHANAWGLPYAALFSGANLVMPARFMTPDALAPLIVDEKVTLAFGVPTIWLGMAEPLKAVRDKLSLKSIICGGSAVPPALQKAYKEGVGVRIIHAWGMTETSPLASICRPLGAHAGLPDEELDYILTSQGRILAGVELRIADDEGTALPWDGTAVGEIQVRGNWIASAYYNDDTSAQKFVDGWLRTGDVATVDADGYIRIVDRTKDLVKSGGEWISSVELEGLIMSHPDVAEAAVIAVAHPKWDERPLACVVARPGVTLTREDILSFLEGKVAKWWLPDDVVFIDEVPKTSVGKFDKKVLRDRFKDHVLPEVAAPAATA
ncbi:MAG TPA: long-chain fatty acid--CoA ligase [Candidatus Solibacter sp.]|nr:long-chain fatty acid--CoA ligase [Candidatus Solibacter sp.]